MTAGGAPTQHASDAWDHEARHETPTQRLDRNFSELLQELRVAQTGVQILLAFLLTMAFSARFGQVVGVGMALYLGTVLLAAAATCLLVGPVALHRLLFRHRAKAVLVESSHTLTLAGLATLSLAVVGSITLVVEVSVGWWWASALGALVAAMFLAVWLVLPLVLRSHLRDEGRDPD